MKANKKVLIPTLALTVLSVAGAVGIESTYANEENGRDSIIEKIAQKFNLNEEEVQDVFDENRQEQQEQRAEQHEERLSQLVSEGKLTEDQKQLLLDKREEMKAEREQNRDAFRQMSREEKQAEREQHRTEMEEWYEENGIDHDVVAGDRDGMREGRRGGGFGRGK